MKKNYLLPLSVWAMSLAPMILQAQQPLYKNAKAPIEQRVKDLLSKMTLEEKAGQLNQLAGAIATGPAANDPGEKAKMEQVRKGRVGSFLNVIGANETQAVQKVAVEQSRLGIPLLFGYDVIHGFKTIFPIPLAEACSWDLAQIEKNSAVAAKEASAAGIHWTFAPMCDITNDPRWGRIMEGIGEDPFYGSLVSAARVKGLQGNLSDNQHVLACVKHFAAYGAVEAGKEYNQVDISRVLLWNKYLPPYKAAVDAGAATVMNAFNVFEGVPASANKYLVSNVLKQKWGFKGFLISDWNSFGEMVNHGYATDKKDVAEKAINAGSMMDMQTEAMVNYLPQLIKEGKVKLSTIDEAVSKILYFKFKLGLFDNPYLFCNKERETKVMLTPEHRNEALKAARSSIVLLKNQQKTLPITANKKIAVIGTYAKSHSDLFDFWVAQGNAKDAVTLYDGLKNAFGQNLVAYSEGYNPDGSSNDALIADAIQQTKNADVVVVNIGMSGKLAGEDRALANPVIPEGQVALLKALSTTGKPIVAVVSAGRPLVLTSIEPYAQSIVYGWILGTESGNAIADVVSGKYNPSGKTVVSFPYAVGQIPVYYNHFNTGRPVATDNEGNWFARYRDIPSDPLYTFGFGLSYTHFQYSNLQLNKTNLRKNETIQASITVTNTGDREGEEVVQLYIRDVTASIIRPVKELKGFSKVLLKAGESKQVTFNIGAKELSFSDADGNSIVEPGIFKVYVGTNSKEVLEAEILLEK